MKWPRTFSLAQSRDALLIEFSTSSSRAFMLAYPHLKGRTTSLYVPLRSYCRQRSMTCFEYSIKAYLNVDLVVHLAL